MKLNIRVDKRQLWQKRGSSKAFRVLLVEDLQHRFSGELPDALGKKLESLTVEISDYGFVDVESATANTKIVKQVVSGVMETTFSQPSWRNWISERRLLSLSSMPTTHPLSVWNYLLSYVHGVSCMLISKAEYAKYKSISCQTVYDWIEKGEVTVSNRKIDMEVTEQRNSPPARGKDTVSEMWPERTLEMTWGESWKAVKVKDGRIPSSVTDDDIQQRVLYVAGELDWGVHLLDDGAICLEDDGRQHYSEKYNLRGNTRLAIHMLRCKLCYVAGDYPDELESWSEARPNALVEQKESDHQWHQKVSS